MGWFGLHSKASSLPILPLVTSDTHTMEQLNRDTNGMIRRREVAGLLGKALATKLWIMVIPLLGGCFGETSYGKDLETSCTLLQMRKRWTGHLDP